MPIAKAMAGENANENAFMRGSAGVRMDCLMKRMGRSNEVDPNKKEQK